MRVLITGDSHTATLKLGQHALRSDAAPGLDISILPLGSGAHIPTPFYQDAGDHAELVVPVYRRFLQRVPPAGARFDWIGVCAPLHTTRVWRQDWSAYRLWHEAGADPGAKIPVSDALLRQVIEDDSRYALGFLDVIRRSARVFVIAAPAPFRHHEAVACNGAGMVMHIHRTYCAHISRELALREIPVVALDPEWMDDQGFMKPRFKSQNPEDRHHGNTLLGRSVYKRIEAFLDQQRLADKGDGQRIRPKAT